MLERELQANNSVTPALVLSFFPSIFAASCCITAPIVVMFGFSVAEVSFTQYIWPLRITAVFLLALSLVGYFYFVENIRSREHVRAHILPIVFITVQTFFYSAIIYLLLVQVAAPLFWQNILQQSGNCCG